MIEQSLSWMDDCTASIQLSQNLQSGECATVVSRETLRYLADVEENRIGGLAGVPLYSPMMRSLTRGNQASAFRNCQGEQLQLAQNSPRWRLVAALANLEHSQKRFLRNIDAPDAFHALLAFFLLLEQLTLTGDVTAVALGEHVLAHSMHRFTSDDLRPDRGLNRNFEHLAGNEFPHLRDQRLSALVSQVAMD